MATEKQPTPFGWVILQRMTALGIQYQAQLAAKTGLAKSTITRVIYAPGKPDSETVQTLARALKVDPNELMALAGHGVVAESAADLVAGSRPDLDPLALEIGAILAPGSPIPQETKDQLRTALNLMIDSYRRPMRARRRSG